MPSPASAQRRGTAGRPLKSPLAVASGRAPRDPAAVPDIVPVTRSALTDRQATLTEFEDYLRTATNREGRPYVETTISAYVGPGKNLDAWMSAQGIDGDFTDTDTALLNRYFREYYLEHGQGGVLTLQRNLIQLFNFLERERGHQTPYTDGLHRYAELKGRPKTLGQEFVDDLLEVTGGGRARDFKNARDHAIIRCPGRRVCRRGERR